MNATVLELSAKLNAALAEPVVPTVGLHEGVTFEEYEWWDAASNSRLSKLLRSAAHLRAYLDQPDKDTAAKVLGGAIHKAVLEPDLFPTAYVRGVEGDGRTKAVQEARARLAADNPRAIVLTPSQHDTALAVRDSVWRHPAARRILTSTGTAEVSGVWQDEATGQLCKLRADYVAPLREVVADLKSTENASPDTFLRSVQTYGYDRQNAFYVGGMKALGMNVKFALIAAEKEPPYAVAVYRLTDEMILGARARLRSLLARYRHCMESGLFPAYSDDVQDLGVVGSAFPTETF